MKSKKNSQTSDGNADFSALNGEVGTHYVNVSVLIKLSQKTSVLILIIISSP